MLLVTAIHKRKAAAILGAMTMALLASNAEEYEEPPIDLPLVSKARYKPTLHQRERRRAKKARAK